MASKRIPPAWESEWGTIRGAMLDGTLAVPDPIRRMSSILLEDVATYSLYQQAERQSIQDLMQDLWDDAPW